MVLIDISFFSNWAASNSRGKTEINAKLIPASLLYFGNETCQNDVSNGTT